MFLCDNEANCQFLSSVLVVFVRGEASGTRMAILERRLGANLNFYEKKQAWEAIVEAVIALGNEQRPAEQIKKRRKNLLTSARKTIMEWEREKAKTGKWQAILDFK